jgi:hypothetical protein
MTRRVFLRGALVTAAAPAMPRRAAGQPPAAAATMARAGAVFLDTLPPAKRRRTQLAFAAAERQDWHYIPRRRPGLPLKDMTPAERGAALALVASGLSTDGYRKVTDIMRLEDVLRQIEMFPFSRDPENYALSVFGPPGGPGPWGWRVEGHHLSLTFTIAGDRGVAVTPAFMGANPAEVPRGPLKGLRVLAREQDLAGELVRGLDRAELATALLGPQSLGDIVSGPGRTGSLAAPAGLALGAMRDTQRGLATRLIEEYARNVHEDMATRELARLAGAGLGAIRFAWAGGLDPGQPHYYRLHGPALLIEYDNTQNDASHIHSVWRDPQRDFGGDLLGAHYEADHHRRA